MAKKGLVIQLQTEVNNDEEWEKLLQRDGLLVVDVYSDWCGPCSAMSAILKKLKLEIGGDVLQLAIAKSDKIAALERFRMKSEPTWLFISNGKMVNFMFGANAPKLTRLIIEELKKETDWKEGRRERVQNEISDLAEEEKERLEVSENLAREVRQKVEKKAAKELFERRTAECEKILETLEHYGIVLVFPHAKPVYSEALGDSLNEVGLTISQSEKIQLTEELVQELFYFSSIPFPVDAVEELMNDLSIVLLVKPIPVRDVTEPTDNLLLEVVYGSMKKPPGSQNSPARVLAKVPQVSEEGEELEPLDRVGVWAPENEKLKATALRLFYPKVTEHYLIPEPEPIPPHYAVIFDAARRFEIAAMMEKYPEEILRYGFFTSDVPEDAQLVAKSIYKYEKAPDRTMEEKMVIQLAKKKSECVLTFAQLKPRYISANVKEGERECKMYFPDDYDEPPEEQEEEKRLSALEIASIKAELESSREASALGSAEALVVATSKEGEGDVVPTEVEMAEGEVAPAEVVPGEVVPDAAISGEVVPGEVVPAEVVPAEIVPAEVIPAEVVPAEVVPAEVAPAEVAPAEVAPAEVVPAEVVTAEVVPAEGEAAPVAAEDSQEAKVEVTENVATEENPESPTTEPTTEVTETTDEETPAQ